jgi:uncharacterized protein YdaU (DUF1376 family)
MGKDPATLWYWNDWYSGTVTLTRHLKGCYMDLLHAQFNNGALSLAEIKTVLGADFGSTWPILQKKFTQDANGNFFNKRAEEVKQDRAKFLEKQRANGLKGGRPPSNKTQNNPTINLNLTNKENEIGNGIEDNIKEGAKFFIVIAGKRVYDLTEYLNQNFQVHFEALQMKPFWQDRHNRYQEYHCQKPYDTPEQFRSHYTAFVLSSKGNSSNGSKSDKQISAVKKFIQGN